MMKFYTPLQLLFALCIAAIVPASTAMAQCGGAEANRIDFSNVICTQPQLHMTFSTYTDALGEHVNFYDYTLPKNLHGRVKLKLKGGDGGSSSIQCITLQEGHGGVGTYIDGSIRIGEGDSMIPRGSTIRYVIGEGGAWSTDMMTGDYYQRGGGGGGSSAILYRAPDSAKWKILMVAGGGGGGACECYQELPTISNPIGALYQVDEDGYPGELPYAIFYNDSTICCNQHGDPITVKYYCDQFGQLNDSCPVKSKIPNYRDYKLDYDTFPKWAGGDVNGGGGGALGGNGYDVRQCLNGCGGGQGGRTWLNWTGTTGPVMWQANVESCIGVQSRSGGRGFTGGGAAYNRDRRNGAGGGGGIFGGAAGGGMGSHIDRATGGGSYVERTLIADWSSKHDTTGYLDGYADFEWIPDPAEAAAQPELNIINKLAPPFCDGVPVTFVARPEYGYDYNSSDFSSMAPGTPFYTWTLNNTQIATGMTFADSTVTVNYTPGDLLSCQFYGLDNNGCQRSASSFSNIAILSQNEPLPASVPVITADPGDTVCERRIYDQFGGYNLEAWCTFRASSTFVPQAYDDGEGGYFFVDSAASPEVKALRACEAEYGVGNCYLGHSSYFCNSRPAANFIDSLFSGIQGWSPMLGYDTATLVTQPACTGFSYYYKTGTSQTNPLPGAKQFVFDAPAGVTFVNQDYSNRVLSGPITIPRFWGSYIDTAGNVVEIWDTLYYYGTDTVLYTQLYGESVTGKFPFTRTMQGNNQWQLTAPNLGTFPYYGPTDYQPYFTWYRNGQLQGTLNSYTDVNGVQHIDTIPFTSDTLWIRNIHEGDVFTSVVTSNHCGTPYTSNSITMHVLPAGHGGVINGPLHPCPGSYVTYEVTGATDVVDYLWTITGNVGSITGTGNTRSFYVDSTDVQLMCIPAGQCGGGDTAHFTISPSRIITGPCPSSSIITTGPLVRCQGQNQVVTLSPYTIGECYQWNNGATTASLTVIDDGEYFVYVNGCKSEVITVSSVAPQQPVVSIAIAPPYPGEEGAWCRSNIHKAILATVTNYAGNPNLNFKWYRNGFLYSTSGTPLFLDLYDFNSFDTLQCTVTLSDSCAATVWSNKVVLPGIFDGGPIGLTLKASSPYSCDGDTITLTALPVNGGDTPSYNWYVDGNFSSNHTNTFKYAKKLTNGTAENHPITCTLAGSPLACRTGGQYAQVTFDNYVYLKVVPTAIISSPVTTVCPNGSVTFTITGDNHGSAPTYQWFKNGNPVGSNSATYTDATPTDAATVYCRLTNNDGQPCVTPTVVSSTLTEDVYVPLLPVPTATPANPCVVQSVDLSATVTPLPGDYVHIGFRDAYGPSQWTAFPACLSGGINTSMMPASFVTNVMHYNASGANCNHDMFMTMPENATISFDWSYALTGTGTDDVPYLLVNGIEYQLTGIDYGNSQVTNKSGHYSIAVLQGQTITFRLRSLVGNTQTFPSGAAVTFSNFGVETQPRIAWYDAPVAGNLIGTTTPGQNLSVTPQPTGTTIYYAEAAGAQAACGQRAPVSVVVGCNHPPVAVCQNVTVNADANCQATVAPAAVNNGSSDQDGDAITYTLSPAGPFAVGTTNVTLTATDVHGSSATCTSTVTVEDNTAPVVTTRNITVQLDASGSATITAAQIDNGSTDACGIASATLDITAFNCGNVGANTVNLTVTDINGNSSTGTATVTVEDNIAPVVSCRNITVQLDATGMAAITAPQIDNGSTDACGIGLAKLNLSGFTSSNIGANTVTLTVTDINGNAATCTATVTVEDNIAPVVMTQNITVQLDASGNATITAAQVDNGSTDASGIASVTLDVTAFDCSDTGTNTVTVTVTDIHGNSSTGTAIVTVEDNVGPDVVAQPVTIQLDTTGNATITAAQVDNGSADACGILSMSVAPAHFTCANTGTNTVTLTVTDVNGNSSTSTAVVTVLGNSATTVNTTLNESICAGFSYTFNGQALTSAGTYYDTIATIAGCDSIVTLNLTVASTINNSATVLGAVCTATQSGAGYQWYTCSTDQLIAGATAQTYTALQNGSYKCLVTLDSCSAMTNCVTANISGIEEVQEYSFNLYPNPNNGSFVIKHNYSHAVNIEINDVLGQRIRMDKMLSNTGSFDISDVAGGVYWVVISNDKNKLATIKVLKQ